MGYFTFTKRLSCPACGCVFTITSAASKYCQNRDCQNKRRRQDYADRRDRKGAYASQTQPGTSGHLARALETGE